MGQCVTKAASGALATAADGGGAARSEVTLVVTPGLQVPKERLRLEPVQAVIRRLAAESGGGGLVDAGGAMPLDAVAPLLADYRSHGFIAAATAAFANHYPLSVRPQHFWLMILQGTAVHVRLNAEEVREKWVA